MNKKKLPNFKQVSRHSSNTVQEDIKNTPSTRKTYSKSNCRIDLISELFDVIETGKGYE